MTSSSSDARNMTLLALPAQDAVTPPSNTTNTLEFQLSQLSAPAVGCLGSMSGGCDVAPQTSSHSSDTFQSASPHLSTPATPSTCNNSTLALQPQHVLPFADSFSFQQFTPAAGALNRQGPAVSFITQLQESNGALPQSLVPVEAKLSERKEFPETCCPVLGYYGEVVGGVKGALEHNSLQIPKQQLMLRSYEEIPELCHTLLALELCCSMDQKFSDEHHISPESFGATLTNAQ